MHLICRGVDMRKKIIGGIVFGIVAVACLTALIVSKETKEDEKTIPEKEIKKVFLLYYYKANLEQGKPS